MVDQVACRRKIAGALFLLESNYKCDDYGQGPIHTTIDK